MAGAPLTAFLSLFVWSMRRNAGHRGIPLNCNQLIWEMSFYRHMAVRQRTFDFHVSRTGTASRARATQFQWEGERSGSETSCFIDRRRCSSTRPDRNRTIEDFCNVWFSRFQHQFIFRCRELMTAVRVYDTPQAFASWNKHVTEINIHQVECLMQRCGFEANA